MPHTNLIASLAEAIVTKAGANGVMIASAESCTGGMIGAAITDVPGSSAVYERGFITYSNEAKIEQLGVPPETIARFGAVSGDTAAAMASGALAHSNASLAISVTGIAGPDSDGSDKPVGLVWFGLAKVGRTTRVERRVFAGGSRSFVRAKSVETGLRALLQSLT